MLVKFREICLSDLGELASGYNEGVWVKQKGFQAPLIKRNLLYKITEAERAQSKSMTAEDQPLALIRCFLNFSDEPPERSKQSTHFWRL